jgi:hypothetical protein
LRRWRDESSAKPSKAITEDRGPLEIVHCGSLIPAEQSFNEIAVADGPIDGAVHECGIGVGRKRGIEFLIATNELEVDGLGKIFGDGDGFVLATAEVTVELGVVRVKEKSCSPDVGESDPESFVE